MQTKGLCLTSRHFLQKILEKAEILLFSFDGSLNEVTQTSEIDFFVRFWDGTDIFVKVSFYGPTSYVFWTWQTYWHVELTFLE